jgi:hypothetical protein
LIYTETGLIHLLEYLLVLVGAVERFHFLVCESHLEVLELCIGILTGEEERERSVVFYS